MQTAKNIGSVVGAGMSGYAMGKEHGNMVVGAARGLDSHMNAANMSAIGGRPMPHDTLVQKYASNKLRRPCRITTTALCLETCQAPKMLLFILTASISPWLAGILWERQGKCLCSGT